MSEHRLIYADELYDTLADKLTWLMKYDCDVYLEVGKDIREAINDQPTAYDIDKVVKQLGNASCYIEDGNGHAGHLVFTDEAIEIVRKGGAENDS